MKLRFAVGPSLAVLVFAGNAMADPIAEPQSLIGDDVTPVRSAESDTATADQIAQLPADSAVAAPAEAPPPVSAAGAPGLAASAPNLAAAAPPSPSASPAPPVPANVPVIKPPIMHLATAAHALPHLLPAAPDRQAAAMPSPESDAPPAVPTLVRAVGVRELGRAAWYGGTYVGRRTSSGERLDTIHATAAHRTLPLNSLARVTNLQNGRSVVVRVTDRGPISPTLLIDMSPRAADQLEMKQAGVVPVMIEQVVEVPPDAR